MKPNGSRKEMENEEENKKKGIRMKMEPIKIPMLFILFSRFQKWNVDSFS